MNPHILTALKTATVTKTLTKAFLTLDTDTPKITADVTKEIGGCASITRRTLVDLKEVGAVKEVGKDKRVAEWVRAGELIEALTTIDRTARTTRIICTLGDSHYLSTQELADLIGDSYDSVMTTCKRLVRNGALMAKQKKSTVYHLATMPLDAPEAKMVPRQRNVKKQPGPSEARKIAMGAWV